MRAVAIACLVASTSAFTFTAPSARVARAQMSMTDKNDFGVHQVLGAAMAGLLALTSTVPVNAVTRSELRSLTYEQVKGTGLANRCPEVSGEASIALTSGKKYALTDLCLEPKSWQVEEETFNKKTNEIKREFVNTKLVTRQTYTLDAISGDLAINSEGKIQFDEKDGIDYAATTVQLPGGERVPFLFTVKELVAKSSTASSTIKPGLELGGSFKVPSYRTGLFLDPKGRGATTGYDMAVALPALQSGEEGDAELFKENNKVFDVTDGSIEFAVNRVNAAEGEIGGVFVSTQLGDTDMGSKAPKKLLIKGIFFGRITPEN